MADLKTAVFDWEAGEFSLDLQGGVQTVTQAAAVAQIVLKAQQTTRGAFLIYADRDNPALHHKYGSDARRTMIMPMPEAARVSELKRNIREALVFDPWITDVRDVEITKQQVEDPTTGVKKWAYFASCTVDHIYGTSNIQEVFTING